MSVSKPEPIRAPMTSNQCPVCKKPAYSKGGIHPQCAANRFSTLARADQKAREAAENDHNPRVLQPELPVN